MVRVVGGRGGYGLLSQLKSLVEIKAGIRLQCLNILRKMGFCMLWDISGSQEPRLVPSVSLALHQDKSSHFRWNFTPISQNALFLLVSGNISP